MSGSSAPPTPGRREVATGVKWSLVSQVGRRVTQLATTVLLARLLSPEDFGLVGMAMAVVVLVDVFKDLGTSAAVVQHRAPGDALLSSVFWLQLGVGIAAAALVAGTAPLAALLFGQAEVTSLLRWLAPSFALSGLGIAHQTLLTRELAFRSLARLEIIATGVGGVVGVGAALTGAGALSLVLQNLAFWSCSSALAWWSHPWRPSRRFDAGLIREVSGYSLHLTGFNLVNYAARNADTLLVGVVLGPAALGFYNMAYRVMLTPLESVSRVIGRVMFPYLSRLQHDDARFGRVYLRWVEAIAFVTFPLMLGLLAVAEPLVHAILGPAWDPLVPLLLILAPAGMLQSVVGTVGAIYKAKGAARRLFRFGLVASSVAVVCFAAGIPWGVQGVAAGATAATLLMAWPNFRLAFELIGLRVTELLRVLWLPGVSAVAMLAAMLLARRSVAPSETEWALLAVLLAVGGASYAAASLALAREPLRELWNSIRAAI